MNIGTFQEISMVKLAFMINLSNNAFEYEYRYYSGNVNGQISFQIYDRPDNKYI
jgi:hypothetical protein